MADTPFIQIIHFRNINQNDTKKCTSPNGPFIDAGVAIHRGANPKETIVNAVVSTAVDGSLSYVIDKGVGAFIKTNKGWIKPQKLSSFFTKSYGQKIMQQSVISGAINTTTASFMNKGQPNVQMIQQLLGIKEDGIYGPKTKKGVKDIQQDLIKEGYLPANSDDGIWGTQTDSAFINYLNDNVSFASVK